MKKRTAAIFLIVSAGLTAAASAQGVRGRPDPTPVNPTEQAIEQGSDISRRSNELRNTENFPVKNKNSSKKFREAFENLYRKPTKEERNLLAPGAELENRYASFLKQKNTGLVRLFKDRNCVDTSGGAVVNAAPECRKFSMPGAGAAYSFREENHRIKNLADLNFTGENFEALGVLLHGVMTDLGDVPLEDFSGENSEAFEFIKSIEPAENFKAAADFAERLRGGFEKNGFRYASILPASLNRTYILRSIAYRGTSPRTLEGIAFNELEFDKRRDLTVAFRVVEKEGESVVILWKELENWKSPTLEP